LNRLRHPAELIRPTPDTAIVTSPSANFFMAAGGGFTTLLLAVLIGWWLTRSIAHPVDEMTDDARCARLII
jgi:hypothetical protein